MRLILNCNNNFNLFCKIRIFLFIKILLLELFFSSYESGAGVGFVCLNVFSMASENEEDAYPDEDYK